MRRVLPPRPAAAVVAALLLAVGATLALHTAACKSLTYDEPKHIATGYYLLSEGDCCLGIDNGPTLALNALPLLGGRHPGAAALPGDDPWAAGRAFMLAEPDLDASVFRARVPSVMLWLALGVLVFVWSRSWYGNAGGLLSAGLFAFSPNLLAHGSLAAGDIHAAFFMTLAVWTCMRLAERRERRLLVPAGVALGLALAAKHSALLLLPALALLALLAAPRGAERRREAAAWAAVLAIAVAVVWIAHGASLAGYLEGVRRVVGLGEQGWHSYLLGEYRRGSWWTYYPVVLAVKTPLPVLLCWMACWTLSPWIHGAGWRREAFLLAPAAVLLIAAMVSDLAIGVRHLLPLYPLMHVGAGRLARLRAGSPMLRRAVAGLLAVWYVGGALAVHPHHLAYFNELAGGPRGGHRVVADSNLDWGQDLKELGRFLEREGIDAVRLGYAGPVPPGRYGIRYQHLPSMDYHREDPVYRGDFGERELLVVSANNLLGITPSLRGTYDWLRTREPVARPGWSLFVFDIGGDADAHRRLIEMYASFEAHALARLERERLSRSTAGR